jgi:LmbE family N-acetylglucosaminyl deacetylase
VKDQPLGNLDYCLFWQEALTSASVWWAFAASRINVRKQRLLPILLLFLPPFLFGQSQELAIDRGYLGLSQALDRLPYVSRVMFIAAHPDDENSGALPYISHGLHAKTALLTLTRGEGGQNLVGPDLFEALGLIRTGEMMAAGEYYGVQQFFTRAFDFGFSKSPAETLQKWGKEAVLSDMVRAIRQFRPHVIISKWQGNKSDGHGHHQAAGLLARQAFQAAADPNRFPEQRAQGLRSWKPQKLYVDVGPKQQHTLTLDAGSYVPLLGASYQEIASKGYSSHRSQGSGDAYSAPGKHPFYYRLVSPEGVRDGGILDGLAVHLSDVSGLSEDGANRQTLLNELRLVEALAVKAKGNLRPDDFAPVVELLLQGLESLRETRQTIVSKLSRLGQDETLLFFLQEKERDFERALELAAGTYFEALADDADVAPGQSFKVSISVLNRSAESLEIKRLDLSTDPGWKHQLQEGSLKTLLPNEKLTLKFSVRVAADARPSVPPWKRNSKQDAFYTFADPALTTAPLMVPRLSTTMDYRIRGTTLNLTRPVEYLEKDPLKGARKIPLLVVPAVQLEVTPAQHLVSTASADTRREVLVGIVNNTHGPISGELSTTAPSGWRVGPTKIPFALGRKGERVGFRFHSEAERTPPVGRAQFKISAAVGGREIAESYQVYAAADLWRFPLYKPAVSEVISFDLRLPRALQIAYIMGAGDRVPETLEQLGIPVKLLSADDLAAGDLRSYDCIIAGVRAYDVRSDLIASNARLLDYVKQGGVFLVQYNRKNPWNAGHYAPYPTKIASNDHRVTDENAPVTILDPQHPAFNFPNKITQKDFEGWVQERGLYFVQERDPRFKPLLAMSDPGEKALDGGLLVADYGSGKYVLSPLAWFRQLPEGVPGAIRLFVNLISLRKRLRETG